MYRRILVPHDGSLFSERALSVAIPLAQQHNASVQVVQVSERDTVPRDEHGLGVTTVTTQAHDAQEGFRAQMQRTVRRLARRYGVQVSGQFREAPEVEAELLRAIDEEADLVVIATHGRSGLSRMWLGSTTDRIIRASSKPVIVVRTARKYTATAPDDPLFPRILVASDGSAQAERVLQEVIRLTGNDRVHIVLARVEPAMLPAPNEAWANEARTRLTTSHLEPLASKYRSDRIAITTHVDVHVDVARALLNTAKNERAFLIAVGTHGYGGVKRAMLGSVADKIVRGADAPVLVVR